MKEDIWRTTSWTLVREAAGGRSSPDADRIWRELVNRYRWPVERAVRRHLRHDADVAAADFFAYLYGSEVLQRADPGVGRFRAYLQGVIRRYVQSWLRSDAGCRAEDLEAIPLPSQDESEFELEEEAEWAESILHNALEMLDEKHPRDANILRRTTGLGAKQTPVQDLCRELGLKQNALYVAAFRAKERLRELVLEEIGTLVSTQADFDKEREIILQRLLEAHPGLALTDREEGPDPAPPPVESTDRTD